MLFLALLFACSPLPEGELVQADWLRPASDVRAALDVRCAGEVATDDPVQVLIDDASGWTILGQGRTLWLRDPFGLIPDRCWWLPEERGPGALPNLRCARDGQQVGTCSRQEDPGPGWVFSSPGVVKLPTRLRDHGLLSLDGTVLAVTGGVAQRLDLTLSDHKPIDDSENFRSFGTLLTPLTLPAPMSLAITSDTVVGYDPVEGMLHSFDKVRARRSLDRGRERRSLKGVGVLSAAGRRAAVVTQRAAHVYSQLGSERPSKERRDHRRLRNMQDALVDPSGTVWALTSHRDRRGVLSLGPQGRHSWHPTPGAQGLVLARPGDVPTVYAWGNSGGAGVVYRLEPDGRSIAQAIDGRLLGAGIGVDFQELVLVSDDGTEVVASGWLDQAQLDAIPEGTVGLALAAFIETPRDSELLDLGFADRQANLMGRCRDPGDAPNDLYTLCCAQQARGDWLNQQLDFLEPRLDAGAAVVLSVNPAAIALSSLCTALDDPALATMGDRLPTVAGERLLDWQARGVGSAAIGLHSAPWSTESWYVGCPGALQLDPPDDCWDTPQDADTYSAFYQALVDSAALSPWLGREPDWRLLAGGFEGAHASVGTGWPQVFPSLLLPDGAPADGLYFGLAGMDPAVPDYVSKELAPLDARARAFPIAVGLPASSWDDNSGAAGISYYPGDSFALPWLYESRRSGLRFLDFLQIPHPATDWSSAAFRGPESPQTMSHADFAVQLHYLTTRVIAHRDTHTPRWWTLHLQDLSRIQAQGLDNGWVVRRQDNDDTELDAFIDEVSGWAPALVWRPHP